MPSYEASVMIIGERINMTRKKLREKVWERDAAFIVGEVKKQEGAGATHLDVNAGGDPRKETDDMKWLMETILPVATKPIVVDSASTEAVRAAMACLKDREGTVINSISGEQERIDGILPIAIEHKTSLVAMCNSQTGMPKTAAERIENAARLHDIMNKAGIPEDKQFYDPLVFPVSTDAVQPAAVIETTREIKRRWPAAHVSYGLSNVSYGLPKRVVMNSAFLIMLMEAGGDCFMIDPVQKEMMSAALAAGALLAKDEYCMNYLKAARAGLFDAPE